MIVSKAAAVVASSGSVTYYAFFLSENGFEIIS
jgi:hypothetical protein